MSDVTHRKRGLRFEKSQLVVIETWARPDEFVCYGHRTWWGGAEGKVSIERWYASPFVEKPFNSKVIKSFVPELRSRKCFSCFGIPMFYVYMLWTFYVHFTYSCMAMLQFLISLLLDMQMWISHLKKAQECTGRNVTSANDPSQNWKL